VKGLILDVFKVGVYVIRSSRDRVVQLCPPARPYIKKSFEGILMYELAGDYINKYCNYADPSIRSNAVIIHL
jgi:hypothetical protein